MADDNLAGEPSQKSGIKCRTRQFSRFREGIYPPENFGGGIQFYKSGWTIVPCQAKTKYKQKQHEMNTGLSFVERSHDFSYFAFVAHIKSG